MKRFRVIVEVVCYSDELDYGVLGRARCSANEVMSMVRMLIDASSYAKPRGARIRVVKVEER